MRVTAILTVYNTERYLAEALDSILSQTRPADEIIAVDDGSTDSTPAVLQRYASRVTLIRQQNGGPARALNVAVAAAKGDALAFLDADDVWLPEKLRIQISALSSDPTLEAVFGAIQQFVSPELDREATKTFSIPANPQTGISKTAMLIHRSAFMRVGLFNERSTVSDFVDWFSRATVLGLRYKVFPEVVTLRRHHLANLGRRKRADQHDEILQAIKRSLDLRRARSKSGTSS